MSNPSQSWLLHAIPEPALLIDPDCRILEANHAIEEALRRPRAELIGKQLERDVLRPAPKQLEALERALAHQDRLSLTDIHLQGVEPTDPVFELEMHPGPSGEIAVFLRESRLELRSSHKSVASMSEADVRRLSSLKDDFLSVAAHELRTPLSSISAFTQLALKHATEGLDPRIRRSLDVTTEQCSRMNFLINEMLDISRIDRGTLELRREPMNLARLVREVAERMRQLTEKHWLELRGLEEPIIVQGDVARLDQVLTNLLSNAIKFSPEGGRILIQAECQADCARLSITDSGLGIPVEAQSRIFERFFRAQDSGHVVEGLGLGLSIARDLVRRHGGDIELSSELGRGTTFMVWLPLEE